MTDFEMPPEVKIELPDESLGALRLDSSGGEDISLYTTLNRREALFGAVFEAIGERFEPSDDIAAVSAPCSVGAEADSFISIYEALGYQGRVNLRAYDINPEAIRRARLGRHLLDRFLYFEDKLARMGEELSRMGFECDFDRVVQIPGTTNFGGFYEIISRSLRERHDVDFQVADLREGLPTDDAPEADVTMANNIFYHLEPDEADKVLRVLASNVSDRGILSMGDIPGMVPYARIMGWEGQRSDIKIGDWLLEAAKVLARDYRMQPTHFKTAKTFEQQIPVIFAKT